MRPRRVLLVVALALAVPLAGQWPALTPLQDPAAHAASHASSAIAALVLAAFVRLPAGDAPPLARKLHLVGLAGVLGVVLAQALEAVSAYTERAGAGPLHTATTYATMLAMAVALAGGVGSLLTGSGQRLPRWAWVLILGVAAVAAVMVLGAPTR